jgi:UDP-N-acetylglucosamine 1-carboxyvinyltransferase
MGAKISGAGSTEIQVSGVRKLHDCEYAIPSDRIVAGTYGAAVLATGGTVSMHGIRPMLDESVRRLFQGFGMEYTEGKDSIFMRFLKKKHWKQQGHFILSTAPYPGFPTDLQSQMMAVMACHVETGIIIENIFENRLQTAEMLNSMGADIQILNNRMALITGVNGLKGCTVEAGDLRGGAALVIAGLMAEGTTRIWGIEYIKRGYEDICRDFSQLGVNIETEI